LESFIVQYTTFCNKEGLELSDGPTKNQNRVHMRRKQPMRYTPVVLRIVTHNINRLKLRSEPERLENIHKYMYNNDIDIMLIQEMNTNT
jgi:hypothetical protein